MALAPGYCALGGHGAPGPCRVGASHSPRAALAGVLNSLESGITTLGLPLTDGPGLRLQTGLPLSQDAHARRALVRGLVASCPRQNACGQPPGALRRAQAL